MSLLEDVFLHDEAGEALELERVIEGDEYDERPRALSPNSDDNSEKDDEAEEDKRRVDPAQAKAKRVVKNPRFILNPARLTGPRGIQVIPDHFKDFKFKGKGHEKDDLDMVLKKLEHWAYRLYPKFKFEDCLKKMETLGKKRPVMVHLHKIRSDQFTSEETVVQRDSSDDESAPIPPQEEDEFDKLLQQQIQLARATPAPGSVKKPGFSTPRFDKSPLTMPKATSSPSISDEQRDRMLKNRRLAEERRNEKIKQTPTESNTVNKISTVDLSVEDTRGNDKGLSVRKQNRSNIIDSSDEECDLTSVNQSVVVDIHSGAKNNDEDIKNDSVTNDGVIEQSVVHDDKQEFSLTADFESKNKNTDSNTAQTERGIYEVNSEMDSNILNGIVNKSADLVRTDSEIRHSSVMAIQNTSTNINDDTENSIHEKYPKHSEIDEHTNCFVGHVLNEEEKRMSSENLVKVQETEDNVGKINEQENLVPQGDVFEGMDVDFSENF